MKAKPATRLAFAALLAGATGIGFAPLLVRFSEVGPSATAFFRLLFALPLLWLWATVERRKNSSLKQPSSAREFLLLAGAGSLFVCDLSIWHWSLQFTTVANSTLLTNLAPVFVALGARVFFGEKISSRFVIGMLLALAGTALLVAESVNLSAKHLLGDGLALIAAVFYAGYQLAVKRLRRAFSTATIMAWSGLVSCPGFLLAAVLSQEKLLAVQAGGWGVLLALALVSHVGGQALIAYGFGHLSASFSSLTLLLQPVVATLLAWLILHESLSGLRVAGGIIVLAGIALASRHRE